MPLALRALLLILLALVPAGLVQLQLERDARETRADQVGDQALRLARLVAQQQLRIIEGAQQVLAAMAAHDAIRSAAPGPECETYLRRLVAAYPRYAAASVFGRDGLPLCTTVPEGGMVQVTDRRYFQEVMAGAEFGIGEFARGRATGVRSIHLARPLRNEAGAIQAVLVVALALDWLVQDLGRIDLPPGSSATLTDRRGVILARSREPERFVGTTLPPSALELMGRAAPGVIDAPALDGVRRIAAYIPVAPGAPGFFVVLGLDANDALASAMRRDRLNAVLIVGSLVLAFTLAMLTFHGIIGRPVRRMLAASASWGRQDWDTRVGPVGGGQELTRLANAFDTMAAEIQSRQDARRASEARLNALLDVSPQVVLTASPSGRITWLNQWWHRLTGNRDASDLDAAWAAAIHPDDAPRALAAWQHAMDGVREGGTDEYLAEFRLRRAADCVHRWHVAKAVALRDTDGEPTGWIGVAVDIHDLRSAEAEVALTAERLRVTYENAPAGLCLVDRDLRFLAINERLAESNGLPVAAHLGRELADVAPHVAAAVAPMMRRVLESGIAVEDMEVRAPDPSQPGLERVWLCSYHPVRDAQGHVTAVSGAVLDITARTRTEDAERLLSREVDHRAKNVLAVVRSLVRLSAAEAPDDVPALVEVLEGRIGAMARVHTILAQERWASADLGELITQELGAYDGSATVSGPPVRLNTEAAQPLAMVLHELATNAAKYGALSHAAGQVRVEWEINAAGVILHWTETGGPMLNGPPRRSGFGSRLIEANVGAQLDGVIVREWRPEGLYCRLTIGGDALIPDTIADVALPLAGRRVLVLEEELSAAMDMSALLAGMGCEVVGPGATIEAALNLLRETGRVDAAVLDVGLAGRPVAELLRQHVAALIFLTRDGQAPEGHEGAVLLERPADAARLGQALRVALSQSRTLMIESD